METKISHSLIKAVSGEFDLESVYKLTLNRMNIRAIENLEGCVNLQELNLSNNEIERIQGLEKLQSLRKITLTSNKISSLQGLDKCAALEHIFVQDNMIDNISEIANVSALKNLKSLYLRNIDGSQKNPVCDHPSYRSSIVRQLPHISILDGERLKHSNTLYADASSSQTTSTAQVQVTARVLLPLRPPSFLSSSSPRRFLRASHGCPASRGRRTRMTLTSCLRPSRQSLTP